VIKQVRKFYFFLIFSVSTCANGTIFGSNGGELEAGKKNAQKVKKRLFLSFPRKRGSSKFKHFWTSAAVYAARKVGHA